MTADELVRLLVIVAVGLELALVVLVRRKR